MLSAFLNMKVKTILKNIKARNYKDLIDAITDSDVTSYSKRYSHLVEQLFLPTN